MRKLQLAAFAAALVGAACVAPAFADGSNGTATLVTSGKIVADAMMDFGSPPSGEVPILFNDHHVYAKPDTLRQGRVLAALVYHGTLLVPLRSMFEQMGATVSYDPGSKSVTAKKEGAQVQVTLGKSEVVINGESRPLDVPPMMYKGALLVPIRVISEGLGAYVQWVPEQHLAVVRYAPPTPVPTAAPTAAPTAIPTPTPSPTPVPVVAPLGYIEGGITFGKVYNEFAAGQNDTSGSTAGSGGINDSIVASGAYKFNPFAIKVDFRQDVYLTTNNAIGPSGGPGTTFNTIDGGSATVDQFRAKQSTLDGRLEYKVADPDIYIGVAYLQASTSYGYPALHSVGGGLEKLPSFTGGLDWFGSVFYFPNANGNYTVSSPSSPNFGLSFKQSYNIVKYDIGLDVGFGSSPFYLYGGYSGDRYTTKDANEPVNQTHAGPYVGIGIHF